MAILAQLLRPVPAARRAYSVFSKPGGGRYFNPAKPPKVAPATNKNKVDGSSPGGDVSPKDQSTPLSPGGSTTPEGSLTVTSASSFTTSTTPVHPAINPHDLKLHQFFSLHRPLLLMSQSPSSIFESHSGPFKLPSRPAQDPSSLNGLEEPPEATLEEDAEAARQLSRALVVNRVGASISWEQALLKLGLDVTQGREEEIRLAEAEFEVYMDSTKRKRRKKMKKHKLKKRRRLSRMQRIKVR